MDTMACPLVSVLTELHCIRIFLNLSSIFHGSYAVLVCFKKEF